MEKVLNKLNIFKEENINTKTFFNITILVMVISSIFGFIYEELFYRIDLGYFVKRGSTYGPWIPIYFFGGGLILLISYRFNKSPFKIFFINCLITGILEYGTGFVLHKFFNLRLWDYNTEIWNFGNINGYICVRSVVFFGISSLILVYLLTPFMKKIASRVSEMKLTIVSYSLLILFFLDMLIYFIHK